MRSRRGRPYLGTTLALVAVLFRRPVVEAAPLAAFLLLFYIPMSYYTDRFFYGRRQRKAESLIGLDDEREGYGRGDSQEDCEENEPERDRLRRSEGEVGGEGGHVGEEGGAREDEREQEDQPCYEQPGCQARVLLLVDQTVELEDA